MSNLLATASINPGFAMLPAYLPARDAAAFWLSNPLLVDKYPKLIEERTEQAGGMKGSELTGLIARLKSTRDKLRHTTPGNPDALQLKELLALVERNETLLADDERVNIRAFAFRLHSLERQWYYDFLKNAFRLREDALDEQHEQAA